MLNRATMRGGVSQREIESRLRVRIRHTIPDDQPLASYTVNRGVPLAVSHKRSAVARASQELAKQLAQESKAMRAAPADAKAKAPGLFARLFGRPAPVDA